MTTVSRSCSSGLPCESTGIAPPVVVGGGAALGAAVLVPSDAAAAASQASPAFALVAGLLLVGATAAREGLFAEARTLASRAPGGTAVLLVVLLMIEAVVTAVLNLDTAVVFMTPVLLHAARRRGGPRARLGLVLVPVSLALTLLVSSA